MRKKQIRGKHIPAGGSIAEEVTTVTKNELTTEQLIDIWEDRREIQNLMGIYVYHYLLKMENAIFQGLWSEKEDVCFGVNDGWYLGREPVRGYYDGLESYNQLKTSLIKRVFPKETENMSEEELHGIGSVDYKPLGSDLIEVADDGETAKGLWSFCGSHDVLTGAGAVAYWEWAFFAVDFIKERGEWKIWHMQYLREIYTPCGQSWSKATEPQAVIQPEIGEILRPIDDFKMPEPTVKTTLRELYRPDRPFTRTPEIPKPYETFSKTFSYGWKEESR